MPIEQMSALVLMKKLSQFTPFPRHAILLDRTPYSLDKEYRYKKK